MMKYYDPGDAKEFDKLVIRADGHMLVIEMLNEDKVVNSFYTVDSEVFRNKIEDITGSISRWVPVRM